MSRYYDDFYPPYRPVAQQRAEAAALVKKLLKKYPNLQPVVIEGTKIAKSFWGKAWCDNIESYQDFANRLPRGRSYVRNGCVVDLHIFPGVVHALVKGSSTKPYKVVIRIAPLSAAKWERLVKAGRGAVDSLLALMQGKLPDKLLHLFCDRKDGLFPQPKEIDMTCSCPDYADLCKHLAAVLYGIGSRLDSHPELLFTLRGIDPQELFAVEAAKDLADQAASELPEGTDLAALFGITLDSAPDLESASEPAPVPAAAAAPRSKASAGGSLRDNELLPTLFAMAEKRGWSKSTMARRIGVSAPTISNWANDPATKLRKSMCARVRCFLESEGVELATE